MSRWRFATSSRPVHRVRQPSFVICDQTIWYYYRTWRDDGTWEHINTLLRRDVRTKAGRDPEPSVGIMDSQSVETTEMGGEKGFNPAKQVKGRKRHLMTDTLGLIIIDSQSVETTEMGGEKGFDPAKQVKGRKRHLMTDTLGLILFVVVCAASIADSD